MTSGDRSIDSINIPFRGATAENFGEFASRFLQRESQRGFAGVPQVDPLLGLSLRSTVGKSSMDLGNAVENLSHRYVRQASEHERIADIKSILNVFFDHREERRGREYECCDFSLVVSAPADG